MYDLDKYCLELKKYANNHHSTLGQNQNHIMNNDLLDCAECYLDNAKILLIENQVFDDLGDELSKYEKWLLNGKF